MTSPISTTFNWRRSLLRRAAILRLRTNQTTLRERCRQRPALFRKLLRTTATAERLCLLLQPWQRRDFAALDAAWMALATGSSAAETQRRAYIERPRGHSKTTDMAVQVAWILQHARRTVRGIAAAADRDQARLLHAAVADLVRQNGALCPDLELLEDRIRHRDTHSRLEVISSDVNSSWGQLPDFVICDELCHWPRPELWYSLCSSAAKQPHCVLAVLTNAGTGTGWTWEAREAARTSPHWYFSSLTGPQAPWITPAALDEQRRLLPPAVYARLWDNVWQHSDGEFVTLAEAEACRDARLSPQTRGERRRRYFAAVDYAEKHDRTVGVIVHRDGERVVVDRMDVLTPEPDRPVLVRWVEDWITQTAAQFGDVRFVVDEYQLLGVIQRLSSRHEIARFDFAGGRGNHALALALRNLIVQRQVAWYPGCGAIPDAGTRDDLETELAGLLVRTGTGGRLRLDHRRDPAHHDDRAFALGAACLEALRENGGDDWIAVTPPGLHGGIAW